MPKNQPTAAKKARATQRAAGGKHTENLRAAKTPTVELRLTWEERDGGHWTTYQGRTYALITHGDWHDPDRWGSKGRDIWYLHEMTPNGHIRHEDDNGDRLEGWWMADAHHVRNLNRHPDVLRTAELHLDGWHWQGVNPDGTRAMSRSTWEQRRPLADLLASTTVGPWIIPEGTCGYTHLIDHDDYRPCPHPDNHDHPCHIGPDFDIKAWQAKRDADYAAAEARWAALTPEQRAEHERLAWEDAYDDGGEQPSDRIDYED